MRDVRVFLVFAVVLMVAGVASGSTRVGIVAAGRVLEAGCYDAESGVLNVTVEFYDVDEDRSPGVSFADIFREYNFADPVEIAMDEISPEDALLIESGSLIYVKYINSTGFVEDENGDVNPWSNTTWSFLELIPES